MRAVYISLYNGVGPKEAPTRGDEYLVFGALYTAGYTVAVDCAEGSLWLLDEDVEGLSSLLDEHPNEAARYLTSLGYDVRELQGTVVVDYEY